METLWQDIRYGLRSMRKSPGFTAVAVLTLALGIGANTTIFSLISAVFLRPLPVEEPHRVMEVFTVDEHTEMSLFSQFAPVSYPNYRDFRDRQEVFTGLVIAGGASVGLSGEGEAEQAFASLVSANYFEVLGVQPALGRFFSAEEARTPGAHPVVVLSHALWQERYGGDPSILNRTVRLNAAPYTVIGVAAEGFRGTSTLGGPDVWVPFMMYQQLLTGPLRDEADNRRALFFNVFGRLKPGVAREQAEAHMKTLARQLEQAFPRENEKRTVVLVPLPESAINPNIRETFVQSGGVLMVTVALVLLIACVNIANLLLARAAGRHREIGIRLAMGAGRGRLVRQLLTESVLLALAGGALGLLVAFWGRDLLWSFRPPFLNNAAAFEVQIDGSVLAFTAGISLLTGLLFGLVPALRASRPDLVAALKERTGPASGLGRTFGLRNALVMGQMALSLVALVGAGLFLRSLWNAQQINPGFDVHRLAVMSFNLNALGYGPERGLEFYRQAVDRLEALPQVEAAGVADYPPFTGGFLRTTFPEGEDPADRSRGRLTMVNPIDTHYLRAAGIPLLRGRGFSEHDREGAPMVCIVNETAAARFYPDQEALGRRLRFFDETWSVEIVGIARDAKYLTLGEEPQPMIYFPIAQHYTPGVTLYVRTRGEPAAALGAVRGAVQALDRNLPLDDMASMPEVIDRVLWAPRMGAGLLGIFGGLALLLASLGIYGVMAYAVNQRTREIGIRMALGAERGDVLRLILGQGTLMVAVGLGVGLGAIWGLSRVWDVSGLLFGVEATDPLLLLATTAALAVAALAACLLPARRAMRVDPVVALRYE